MQIMPGHRQINSAVIAILKPAFVGRFFYSMHEMFIGIGENNINLPFLLTL